MHGLCVECQRKIEAAQETFKTETQQMSSELAAMSCKKDALDEQVTELRLRHKQKEAVLRTVLTNHENQQERNQHAVERVG